MAISYTLPETLAFGEMTAMTAIGQRQVDAGGKATRITYSHM